LRFGLANGPQQQGQPERQENLDRDQRRHVDPRAIKGAHEPGIVWQSGVVIPAHERLVWPHEVPVEKRQVEGIDQWPINENGNQQQQGRNQDIGCQTLANPIPAPPSLDHEGTRCLIGGLVGAHDRHMKSLEPASRTM
jgi:hypothetical protein